MKIREALSNPFVVIGSYIFLFSFVVFATKAYLGYFTVKQTIIANERSKLGLLQNIDYLHNYRLPYLNSPYAQYFANHENGVSFQGEQVIRVVKENEVVTQEKTIVVPSGIKQSWSIKREGRKGYFEYKLEQVKR